MRLLRLAALLGSLILLVATAVSVINSRAEARSDQTAAVESSADIVSVAVRTNVAATLDAMEIAAVAAAAPGVDRAELATELTALFDDADSCIGAGAPECTGPDLSALSQVGDLVAETGDGAVATVDATTDSVLFVRRIAIDGAPATVVLQVPTEQLVRATTLEVASSSEVTVELRASTNRTSDERNDAAVADGERFVEATIGEIFVDGSITIRTSTDSGIAFLGDRPARYATLLILGTLLLGLALWIFLRDRRSLERQATTDELTGLVNRREFEHMADEALDVAARFGTGLCVMVIDLNGFKQVNDTLGHQFGDLVLKASAERLIDAVRDTDVVARWGGDEFVIMLPGLHDRTAVRNSAERISETLAGSPVVGDTVMTASIGAAIFPRHGESLDALMRAADVAMYGAKTTGVGHRIADTIAAQGDLLGNGGEEPSPTDALAGPTVDTTGYVGPDRRRMDPLPPPVPDTPAALERADHSAAGHSAAGR